MPIENRTNSIIQIFFKKLLPIPHTAKNKLLKILNFGKNGKIIKYTIKHKAHFLHNPSTRRKF